MPVEIVEKRKTEPTMVGQHKALVPLRVVSLDLNRLRDCDKGQTAVVVGEILVNLPNSWLRTYSVFNASQGTVVDDRFIEAIRVVRAYDIQQIVICNDDEPAPIL